MTTDFAKPTRERILDSALRLFADQGYEATSIGEIESAAGLAPRSGALYKHFPSKRALIDAALAERFGAMDEVVSRIELMPRGDLRGELEFAGRLSLAELERERDLCRLVMKEGDRFPDLARAFHAGIVERGHAMAAAWLSARAEDLGRDIGDVPAIAQVMMDGLVGYVLQQHIFGPEGVAVERERVLAAWVALGLAYLDPTGTEGRR
jgi:AcrR family transcriptional regulator